MWVLLLSAFVIASEVGNKETISELKSDEKEKVSWKAKGLIRKTISSEASVYSGNLPSGSKNIEGVESSSEQSPVIRPKDTVKSFSIPVNVGDIYDCRIYQDIIGYAGSVSPVRAEILSGPLSGYMFIGNATMDPKTKNVLIQFHKIRSKDGKSIVRTTATVHSSSGSLGIEGTLSSHYWRYFFASVLSAAAAGYSQATVQRSQSLVGFQNNPTTDTAAKVGAAEGFSQTADLMAENMKAAPEFTTVRGPITTKVFIIDDQKI
ncbi:MAG: hypothetical protein IT245_01285 [Bacteroidia bacterium]|nr:hypothetical protein [Bacteroidia bacterium]